MVTNLRHQQELVNTEHDLHCVIKALKMVLATTYWPWTSDKHYHLEKLQGKSSSIGGQATDDLLDNIFSKFCIGK